MKNLAKNFVACGDKVVAGFLSRWHAARVLACQMVGAELGAANLKGIISIVVTVVILGTAVPVLWPMFAGSDTDIQAMVETDDGTVFIQTFWPIMILIGGIGLVVGILYMVMKRFKLG